MCTAGRRKVWLNWIVRWDLGGCGMASVSVLIFKRGGLRDRPAAKFSMVRGPPGSHTWCTWARGWWMVVRVYAGMATGAMDSQALVEGEM